MVTGSWRGVHTRETTASTPRRQRRSLHLTISSVIARPMDSQSQPEPSTADTQKVDRSASSDSLARLERPDPRSFTHFPEKSKCPICGTNDDGKCVLVEIAGTANDGIAEAKPMHLSCAVAKQWDDGMQMGFTWPNEKADAREPLPKPVNGITRTKENYDSTRRKAARMQPPRRKIP